MAKKKEKVNDVTVQYGGCIRKISEEKKQRKSDLAFDCLETAGD